MESSQNICGYPLPQSRWHCESDDQPASEVAACRMTAELMAVRGNGHIAVEDAQRVSSRPSTLHDRLRTLGHRGLDPATLTGL